jgi:hypothetical protein
MNDHDVQVELEKLLRAAPIVPAPARLRQAVQHDRTERASGRGLAGHRSRGLAGHRSRGTVERLAGLAATLVLVAVGLMLVSQRGGPSTPATPPAVTPSAAASASPLPDWSGPPPTISWRGSATLDGNPWFTPVLVNSGGKLYAVSATISNDQDGTPWVWSTEDGSSWSRLDAAPLPGVGHFQFLGASGDGRGGLVMYGIAADKEMSIWHSADGRNWKRAGVKGVVLNAWVNGVAESGGRIVAVGYAGASGTAAWYSIDGDNWQQAAATPSSFDAIGVLNGRFIAESGTDLWVSDDGSSWNQWGTLPEARDADLIAYQHALVAVANGGDPPLHAYLSREDGTWQRSDLPWAAGDGDSYVGHSPNIGLAYRTVVLVRGVLVVVAFGSSFPAGGTFTETTPRVWVSTDGLTWSRIASEPALETLSRGVNQVATVGGRVVVLGIQGRPAGGDGFGYVAVVGDLAP